MRYPVSQPDISSLEQQYAAEAVASGWVSSLGAFITRFEQEWAARCGTRYAVAVSNGTDALFLALRALGVGPGDEVVVPDLTFVAVAAVVRHLGAVPILADVDPDTWCLCPKAVDRAVTQRTKAIVVVHSYGHPADLDALGAIAAARGIALVEDAAEAHGAAWRDRPVGSWGVAACFSFYGNKIITTGEGGAVVSDDERLVSAVRMLKDHAMDPQRRYYHPQLGYNCRMTNVQAAIGCAQIARMDALLAARARILEWYREELAGSAVTLNPSGPHARPVNWMVSAVLPARVDAAQVAAALRADGVDTRPFFVPIHTMPPYRDCPVMSARGAGNPVSADLARRGINLPTYTQLERGDVAVICRSLLRALPS